MATSMKQSDLKKLLKKHGIEWSEWRQYMIGKTVSEFEGESYYWPEDIKRFFLQKELNVTFPDFD